MLSTGVQTVRMIPWISRDSPLVSPHTQAPMLSRGSLGHPGILPWCPLRQRPPCCLEDSLDIPGSSHGVPQTQTPMLSLQDPLDIPGSSLGVPSHTGPHAVQRILWTSRDPPMVFPQTEAPMRSGGSLGHPGILSRCSLTHRPPCCPEDPLDIPGSFGHPRILPRCSLTHRPPCCPENPLDIPARFPLIQRHPCFLEDPLDIPGSSLDVPSDTDIHAVRRIPWTSWEPPMVFPQTQPPMLSLGHPGILPWCPEASMLSRGLLGHPRILPRCSLTHRPPCCPEDTLDILGSSLGVPSDRGPHAVQRIPWTSRDPLMVSPQRQAPMLSGGSLGLPGIFP